MITCLNRNEIESNGGQIVTNSDGTISVYNNVGIPTLLTKPCCEAIGGIFDVDTQKCMWSEKSTKSSPFNIILNPRGNSGEIFYVTPDEVCTLQVSFDFLFKFNCEELKTMNSNSVITMFESIFAGMTINTKNGASIDKVYEETIFNKIGIGNCYTYISSAGTDTGFYICGDLSENTVTNDCLPLNLYSLKTNNGTLDCKNAQQFIVEGLFKQSGLATTDFDKFKFNINENAFASNWLNFKTEITDASVLSAITNQKIVLAIKVSGAPEYLSILIDNIELNKVCKKLGKTTFLSSSPGFELDRIKDNKKSWVANTTRTHREFDINRYDDTLPIRQTDYYLDDERQVINTKEIDLDINLAHAVESDVWCYITSNPCILTGNTVGITICSGQVSTQIYTSTTATDGVTTYSCPAGYTATTGNEQCQKITTTGSTFYGTSYTCQLSLSGVKSQYNNGGAVFYEKIDLTKTPISTSGISGSITILEPLFYGNGTGTSFTVQSRVSGTSNTLWVNDGLGSYTTKGRLNNAGIFSSTPVSGTTPQFIGFSHCLNIPVGGTYSLGICGDNFVKLKINGQQVVNFDKWSGNLGFWHVFPIDLKSGLNIIELSGADALGPPTNYTVASFAAEIYSASTTVLSALTTTIQLEPYIVFSTKNKVGSTFDIGDSSGYYCPSGYVLDTCNGYSCVKIENAPITATTTAGTIASSGTFCSASTTTYCCSDSCGDKPIDINRLLTQPLSAVTTIEDFEYFLTSELIDAKNRQTITSYPTLRLLYNRYMNSLNYCGIKSSAFDYYTMEKFSKLIGNYWTDLIEQVIPATTIWNSTKVYTNTIFDEQKYKYKGYTSLFGTNPCDDIVPLSPTTGTSCGIDVKTVFVQGGPQNTLQFLRELNVSEYDRIYLLQMNSSNEFLGNVSSTNRSSSCYNIAECTLAIDITHVDETYPLNNGSATVNIYGANGTPSILWSNGQTTNTITGLSGGTYSVKVTDSICDKTQSVTIKPSTQPPTLTWSAYTFSCETETTFAIRKTISGLSSPFSAFYYTGTTPSRVYIADGDSAKGNIYWFDPKTATTESHMNYYSGIKANNVYTTFFDSKYLRAYLIGTSLDAQAGGSSPASKIDVSGLTVYDITTNTHYVVPYGSNIQYQRQTILVTNDYIFTKDSTISPSGGYRRFNRANPLSTSTAIPYPSGQLSYFKLSTGVEGAPQPYEVGDKIWLVAGSGNNNGNIGIFDTSFNYLTQIVLPVKSYTGFGGTKYWQGGYYDKTYNRFYVNEINGKYRYVFEPNAQYTGATCIMSGSVGPYLENKKTYTVMSWSIDPVTNKLYNIFSLGNSELDSNPIYKTYEINRSSGQLLKLYNGYSFAELVQVNDGLFDSLAGTQGGSVYWQNNGNAWSGDGQVVLYNNSISGNTTGRVSVKTLELYSNNNPTGTIKDNQIGTEGYIAPYTDYTTCPPYFDLRCPTILKTASGTTAGYAEVQLAQSVQNNPAITKITVSALTSGYSAMTSTSYTPPFSGYTFVTFTGLPATLGNVGVTYYSGGSPSYVQLSACTT
jgi:hypothetical protein